MNPENIASLASLFQIIKNLPPEMCNLLAKSAEQFTMPPWNPNNDEIIVQFWKYLIQQVDNSNFWLFVEGEKKTGLSFTHLTNIFLLCSLSKADAKLKMKEFAHTNHAKEQSFG